ncbi:hypothetical protein BHE74_00002865 [Ensete ventricosum]|nr:hypothetical protein BHE74_00002865 [Ensete ventricosum]
MGGTHRSDRISVHRPPFIGWYQSLDPVSDDTRSVPEGRGSRPASLAKSGESGSLSGREWRQRKEETTVKGERKRGDPISHRRPGFLEESNDFLGHRTLTHRPVSPSIEDPKEGRRGTVCECAPDLIVAHPSSLCICVDIDYYIGIDKDCGDRFLSPCSAISLSWVQHLRIPKSFSHPVTVKDVFVNASTTPSSPSHVTNPNPPLFHPLPIRSHSELSTMYNKRSVTSPTHLQSHSPYAPSASCIMAIISTSSGYCLTLSHKGSSEVLPLLLLSN